MHSPIYLVVSDLHIAAGDLDSFDDELESHFCAWLGDMG